MKMLISLSSRLFVLGCFIALAWKVFGPVQTEQAEVFNELAGDHVANFLYGQKSSGETAKPERFTHNKIQNLQKNFDNKLSAAEEMYMRKLELLNRSLEKFHLDRLTISENIPDGLPQEVRSVWINYVESLKKLEQLNLETNGIDDQFLKMAKAGFLSSHSGAMNEEKADVNADDSYEEDPSSLEQI